MRTFALLFLMTRWLPAAINDSQIDWQRRATNSFYKHFNNYYRRLFSCPEGKDWYNPKTECHPGKGTLDAREYTLAREDAKRLFRLKD